MYLTRTKHKQQPPPLKEYYEDIGALAVRPQKKIRYLILNGRKLKINYIFVQKRLGKGKYHGYYCFVAGTVKQYHVRRFWEQIHDIGKSNVNHDKTFVFPNGVEYYGYRPKAKAEHIQGFKRIIYELYKGTKRNNNLFNAEVLFMLYRYYFDRLGLKEIIL